MVRNELMKWAIEAPETYKKLQLTERQRKIVLLISDGDFWNSEKIADAFGISIQSASVQLNSLVRKGYLDRENVGDPSGGKMYQYRIDPELTI